MDWARCAYPRMGWSATGLHGAVVVTPARYQEDTGPTKSRCLDSDEAAPSPAEPPHGASAGVDPSVTVNTTGRSLGMIGDRERTC